MKKQYLTIILLTVLILSVYIENVFSTFDHSQEAPIDLFFGVDVAFDNLDEMYALIDEVSPYTNLFVIGTEGISNNRTKLIETCQYLYDQDMYFIIYTESFFRLQLMRDIENRYGDHFLGVYFDDEQGGRQLDLFEFRWVYLADDYSDAAIQFVQGLKWWLNRNIFWNETYSTPRASDFHLFTSDYTLYWFDYEAGYDTVFAEFGWNYSRQLNVALCRGAATVQNKDWGVIMAWTYNNPPYIESGQELFEDMILAYNNGAKYILIFDSNRNYTQGILKQEHLEAIKQFWDYKNNNPRTSEASSERIAYVLPKDYGYGFRGPDDKIWGLWEADSFSYELSVNLGSLLEKYGTKLDIIYDEPQFNFQEKYSKIYFWDNTIIFGNISCTVSSSSVVMGNSITISGVISPPVLSNVTLQISNDNSTTWVYLATLPIKSDGSYSYDWTPESVGSYDVRAVLKEDSSISVSNSSNVLVTASKIFTSISLSVSSSLINEGESMSVSGDIDPAVSGKTVTLTIKRPDGLRQNRTVTTGVDGSFVDSFLPDAAGYWSVSASWDGDSLYSGAFKTEEPFEVTNLYRILGLHQLTIPLVGSIVAGIVLTVLILWFILRARKMRLSKTVIAGYVVKAHLIGLGNGTLEFIDNVIKFTLKEGRIRKSKRLCRKISIADINDMNRIGNQLRITWKGVTDTFVIEDEELAGTIFERIPQSSRKQKIIFEDKKVAKQNRKDLIKMLRITMRTIDLLFNILWSLKGKSYWNRVDSFLNLCADNVRYLKVQGIDSVDVDFTNLSLAIKDRNPEETSKETYGLLRVLYDYFDGLSTTFSSLMETHPNFSDIKRIVLAYYMLNDIILSLAVEDRVEEDMNTLVNMLDNLSKNTGIKINTALLKEAIDKVGMEQEKEGAISKSRMIFRQQLIKLIDG